MWQEWLLWRLVSASQPIGNETNTHKHMRCDIKYVKIKMQYKIVNFSGKLSNRARYDVCVCTNCWSAFERTVTRSTRVRCTYKIKVIKLTYKIVSNSKFVIEVHKVEAEFVLRWLGFAVPLYPTNTRGIEQTQCNDEMESMVVVDCNIFIST